MLLITVTNNDFLQKNQLHLRICFRFGKLWQIFKTQREYGGSGGFVL